MAVRVDVPSRVVVDAGPLIGGINTRDAHHEESVRGLTVLAQARTRVVVPLPVAYEVYKRLAYGASTQLARRALTYIQMACEVLYVTPDAFQTVNALVIARPGWPGSLEDATLAVTGIALGVPVWTFNYRDLSGFAGLQFWTPG